MIRATGGSSRRTNQMDWQIGNVWSCPTLVCDDLLWFPMICGIVRHENPSAKCVLFAYELTWGRLGADPKRICIRSDPTNAKRIQNGPKMDPSWIQIAYESTRSEAKFAFDTN